MNGVSMFRAGSGSMLAFSSRTYLMNDVDTGIAEQVLTLYNPRGRFLSSVVVFTSLDALNAVQTNI
jgi:hypothetical protein